MDIESEHSSLEMFSADDIPKIMSLFEEADEDGGGGLDIEQFCVVMERLYGAVSKDDLIALHMQVDTNCDLTVDINELLDFLWCKTTASKKMDFVNQTFPKPITIVPVDHYKAIVGILFLPYRDPSIGLPETGSEVSQRKTKTYQKGQYLSISSDGILNFWNDRFDSPYPIALHKSEKKVPFSHSKKMCVNNMVHLRELQQLAISTSDRELLFYHCNEFPKQFIISHSLIVEDNIVHAMNYWSNGTKAVFSIGDMKGYLYVFISYSVQKNGLFCAKAYEKISLHNYPTVYVSALFKNFSADFLCVKAPIFNDTCGQIRYFPSLDSFAVCGSSSKTMVLVTLSKSWRAKVSKKVFESRRDKDFFTCVEYSASVGHLVTGGTDGILRVWFPHKTMECELELKGHVRPVIQIRCNPDDKIFVSLSEDKNICVWSEDGWLCRQSFQVQGMGLAPISSLCYNIHNNELVLANSNIGTFLGRGTDVFQNMITSHDKPLCCTLYHHIFKQVISVCQNGVVTVWDIVTGKAVMQFKVTPDQHVGPTAVSFDGPQRRLITVTQDGKVRLWNFNNGSLLDILPVTVPKKVSGIICIDNRIFVSGRNSKIIFDLDIEEDDHRFLQHDYLTDISSMDFHENTLVTASSNGNIVIWDVDSAEVLYWLNASKSPRTHLAGKKDQGQTGSLDFENSKTNFTGTGRNRKPKAPPQNKPDLSIGPMIICLKTRGVNANTATLLTCENGYICAWSVVCKGGLLRKFKAVNEEGILITTMSTDANEEILLIGDSAGKIYMWDIQEFGFKQTDKGPYEDVNGWQISLCPPPLFGSWQAHITAVVSVKSDPGCKKLVTAGNCNVRLWTNTGCFIGLFGKDQWDGTQLSAKEYADQEQEGRQGITETRNVHIPFPDPTTSPPDSPTPNYDELIEKLKEATATAKITPVLTHEEFFATYRKWIKVKPGFDKLKDLQNQFNEQDKNCVHQSPSEVLQGFENTLHPIDSTKTELKQSSSELVSPYSNQPRSKRGHGFEIPQRDHVLTPFPADPLPGKLGYKQTSKRVRLPPIPEKVWVAHRQPNIKPRPAPTTSSSLTQASSRSVEQKAEHTSRRVQFPPILGKAQITRNQSQAQTRLNTGGNDLNQSSPHTTASYFNQIRAKYGRVLKVLQEEALKGIVFTPYPPDTPSDKPVEATSTCDSAEVGPH